MKLFFKKVSPFLILNLIGLIVIIILVVKDRENISSLITRDKSEDFTFTSPILDCENAYQSEDTIVGYKEIHKEAENLSEKYSISNFSIYFRDLNNGPWVGINEKALFSPASLMKTPILIAFLKNAERNPQLLEKKVVATDEYFDYALKQNFEVKTKIEKGGSYTLEQLLTNMIAESDNIATLMLSKYVVQSDYNNLLEAVGLEVQDGGEDVDVRVKDFAGFFRVLYNASYLNREYSEFALSILSKSTFKLGIVDGLPREIQVAHKYGERSIEQKQDGVTIIKERQLHDCGIVYSEKNPYILCVMTRGKDFEKQESFISEISKFVYNEVSG